jgi:hypothetical protein
MKGEGGQYPKELVFSAILSTIRMLIKSKKHERHAWMKIALQIRDETINKIKQYFLISIMS